MLQFLKFIAASGWLIYLKCTMMHGLANFKFTTEMFYFLTKTTGFFFT
jgi:hypothetical protein